MYAMKMCRSSASFVEGLNIQIMIVQMERWGTVLSILGLRLGLLHLSVCVRSGCRHNQWQLGFSTLKGTRRLDCKMKRALPGGGTIPAIRLARGNGVLY
jgi:hypothetical protein